MKHIVAVVSFSFITSDSRVLRQISSLSAIYDVVSIGFGPPPLNSCFHLSLDSQYSLLKKLFGCFLLLFRNHRCFFACFFHKMKILSFLDAFQIKAIILNDASSWPLSSFFPSSIIILDAHEFTPNELSDRIIWRLFLSPYKLWCSQFSRLARRRFCVESNLCAMWHSFSGVSFDILPNSSYYVKPISFPSRPTFSPLRVLHHGVAHPSRKIENMIQSIGLSGDSYQGTFFLTGQSRSYIDYLSSCASHCFCEVLDPVPQSQLIELGSQYDVAILSIYPSNINYKYCLPNKLYQFIQSRLPIICGPTPSIASIVTDYQIGIVSSDFSAKSLSEALCSLTPSLIRQMRQNLDKAAKELCWDLDQYILLDAVESTISLES